MTTKHTIPIAYVNFATLDMAISFYDGKIPNGYVPIFSENQINNVMTERDNAERREYEILGRADATENRLKKSDAILSETYDALQEAKHDISVLIYRLLDADETNSSPETLEVIEKWKKLILNINAVPWSSVETLQRVITGEKKSKWIDPD